jgi:hypothetical protein
MIRRCCDGDGEELIHSIDGPGRRAWRDGLPKPLSQLELHYYLFLKVPSTLGRGKTAGQHCRNRAAFRI